MTQIFQHEILTVNVTFQSKFDLKKPDYKINCLRGTLKEKSSEKENNVSFDVNEP